MIELTSKFDRLDLTPETLAFTQDEIAAAVAQVPAEGGVAPGPATPGWYYDDFSADVLTRWALDNRQDGHDED